MKKHTLLMATAMAVVSSPALAQFAPGDTTDYETASVSIWTEDKANDVVEYADQFACIVKNSRGDLFGRRLGCSLQARLRACVYTDMYVHELHAYTLV